MASRDLNAPFAVFAKGRLNANTADFSNLSLIDFGFAQQILRTTTFKYAVVLILSDVDYP